MRGVREWRVGGVGLIEVDPNQPFLKKPTDANHLEPNISPVRSELDPPAAGPAPPSPHGLLPLRSSPKPCPRPPTAKCAWVRKFKNTIPLVLHSTPWPFLRGQVAVKETICTKLTKNPEAFSDNRRKEYKTLDFIQTSNTCLRVFISPLPNGLLCTPFLTKTSDFGVGAGFFLKVGRPPKLPPSLKI